MKPVVIETVSGEIGVIWPTGLEFNAEDEVEKLRLQGVDVAGQIPCKVTELPLQHRWAREAWRRSGDTVQVDLPAAKTIAHEKRRARRENLMAPLDKLATSPVAAIKNKALTDKQAILDADSPVQTAIDAAASADALKTILQNYGAI
jgi:hypothetical protein